MHLSHFIGRARELSQLAALLPKTRLLTLTGAGGSGKTRLATQVATAGCGSYARIAWTDLAPLMESALLAQHVARALHVPEGADVAPVDLLVDDIGVSATLLVLDNCEHLVDACAMLAEQLLTACPNLTILATSREALSIASETAWLVPPMVRDEAIQLFVDRARGALPSFELGESNETAVAEICRRLDGIPLAIELAAARVRALTPIQIAQRLDDAFRVLNAGSRTALPRHRTLRGTMEWSYELLNEREQLLLARLSVFAGSFSLDAAESVCQGGRLASNDILDGVAALVDKSLVVMEADEDDARYHLLETVRQYGRERLTEAGDVARFEEAHALYFVGVAEETGPHLIGGEDEPGVLFQLHREAANLRVACAWSLRDPGRAEYALRFSHHLFWYWYSVGEYRDAFSVTDGALKLATPDGSPLWYARAMAAKGLGLLSLGDGAGARAVFDPAIMLLTQHGGSADELAVLRIKRAASFLVDGDPRAALDALRAVEKEARASSHFMMGIFWRFWTGWASLLLGRSDDARDLLQQNISVGFAHGHEITIAHGCVLLGRLALQESRTDEAKYFLKEALVRYRKMTEGWGVSLGLSSVARLISLSGDHPHAITLQMGIDALRRRSHIEVPESERAERDDVLARGKQSLTEAEYAARETAGRVLSRDQVIELALRLIESPISGTTKKSDPVYTTSPGINSTGAHRAVAIANSRLRVRALGPLEVALGDRILDGAEWGSARPREMLMFLLLHPNGVTKEQAGLAFWPEASTAQLRNSFHVTLHRLRKVLAVPGVIAVSGERYHLDASALAEFDVTLFERDVTAARRAVKQGNRDAIPLLSRALDRYKGDLLDGEPVGDWHLSFRDHLQTLFLDASMELGEALCLDERFDAAADTFRRILAHDHLNESASCGLMRCQARSGERVQALRTYERLVAALARELETGPQPATLALAARIQRGEIS